MKITNKEAKEILEEVKVMDDSMYQYNPAYLEALNMAIEALKAETPTLDGMEIISKALYDKLIEQAAELERIKSCEDAVSLDSVIDTIEWYRTNPQHFTEDNLIEDIKGLPPVTPKQRWIPVSERLPKTHGVYNVTRRIDGTDITDSCFYDGQGTWYDDTRINHARKYLDDIVAWTPLPESYTEGENK